MSIISLSIGVPTKVISWPFLTAGTVIAVPMTPAPITNILAI